MNPVQLLPALAAMLVLQATDPLADFHKARELAAAGELQAAASLLERSLEAFPGWGLPHLELADILMRTDADPARQGRALAEARRLEPQNPRAWALSAVWFERRGEPEAAIDACRRALALRDDMVDTRVRLALLLVAAERHLEAVPELQRVLEARPEERGVRANLADALEKVGDPEGAERELKQLLRLSKGNLLFARRLARFYERTGRPDEAARVLREAGEERPERRMRPLPDSKH
jgi:tetratricopeptide (TPR) repeat protein